MSNPNDRDFIVSRLYLLPPRDLLLLWRSGNARRNRSLPIRNFFPVACAIVALLHLLDMPMGKPGATGRETGDSPSVPGFPKPEPLIVTSVPGAPLFRIPVGRIQLGWLKQAPRRSLGSCYAAVAGVSTLVIQSLQRSVLGKRL